LFQKSLTALLDESFERVEGIYLDRGTLLFKILQSRDSWQVRIVDESRWRDLLRQLRDAHREVVSGIKNFDDWNEENRLGDALAVVAHTAYHLGAIRQIHRANKSS
jgi:hypothetical protein